MLDPQQCTARETQALQRRCCKRFNRAVPGNMACRHASAMHNGKCLHPYVFGALSSYAGVCMRERICHCTIHHTQPLLHHIHMLRLLCPKVTTHRHHKVVAVRPRLLALPLLCTLTLGCCAAAATSACTSSTWTRAETA